MKIRINLDIDGNMQTISMAEARDLYFELNSIFGQNNTLAQRTGNTEKKAVETKNKATEKPKEDIYKNPRVEAARDRAAQRTSGCGARR